MGRLDAGCRVVGTNGEQDSAEIRFLRCRGHHDIDCITVQAVNNQQVRVRVIVTASLHHAAFAVGGKDVGNAVNSPVRFEQVEAVAEYAVKYGSIPVAPAYTVKPAALAFQSISEHMCTINGPHEQ